MVFLSAVTGQLLKCLPVVEAAAGSMGVQPEVGPRVPNTAGRESRGAPAGCLRTWGSSRSDGGFSLLTFLHCFADANY